MITLRGLIPLWAGCGHCPLVMNPPPEEHDHLDRFDTLDTSDHLRTLDHLDPMSIKMIKMIKMIKVIKNLRGSGLITLTVGEGPWSMWSL